MKRLNSFSRFIAEVMGRGGVLRTPNPESRTPRFIVVILALMLIAAIGFTPQSHAQVRPGDTLVIDSSAGTGGNGALFRISPNGGRTLLSDFGSSAQGTLGVDPAGVAINSSGNILVIDSDGGTDSNGRGALFRVNPTDGSRTLVNNFDNDAQGPLGFSPIGVAVESSGNILVIDPTAGTTRGALFRINPENGDRILLSDFDNSAQGALGEDPFGVALDASGNILVIDEDAGTNTRGALFRVNPSNGSRTLVSDFGNTAQGILGIDPVGVALDASGNILVTDQSAGTSGKGALLRVNPADGSRTLVSDFGNNAQGTLGADPTGVALDASGNVLVIEPGFGMGNSGLLFRVNPASGDRTLLSDFGNNAQGTPGIDPFGVAAVPPQPRLGDILVIDANAGVPVSATNIPGALFIVNPLDGSRSLISNFGVSAQGSLEDNPSAVAVDASGNILVIGRDGGTDLRGALFRINPANGNRAVLSDFGNITQGPLGAGPVGLTLNASGNILVLDQSAGTGGIGALFRVNPSNGSRTLVSDFGDSAQGTLVDNPFAVAVESSGNILVTDPFAGTNGSGALFRVTPANGNRTVVSDFGNSAQGALGFGPRGVALESSGNILVTDFDFFSSNGGTLFRVNPTTGSRTVVSDFGNSTQGPLGVNPSGVALDASGSILVIDPFAGTNGDGALFAVNPSGGSRIVVSDFGDPSKGIQGALAVGVSVFTVKCAGLNATRIGNSFTNTINGTVGPDVIHGMGGKDTINGRGGNDVICGGSGNDTLSGGIGNDRLFGQAGFDTLNGNQGNDTLNGGSGADTCNGGLQRDTATGGCETRISVP